MREFSSHILHTTTPKLEAALLSSSSESPNLAVLVRPGRVWFNKISVRAIKLESKLHGAHFIDLFREWVGLGPFPKLPSSSGKIESPNKKASMQTNWKTICACECVCLWQKQPLKAFFLWKEKISNPGKQSKECKNVSFLVFFSLSARAARAHFHIPFIWWSPPPPRGPSPQEVLTSNKLSAPKSQGRILLNKSFSQVCETVLSLVPFWPAEKLSFEECFFWGGPALRLLPCCLPVKGDADRDSSTRGCGSHFIWLGWSLLGRSWRYHKVGWKIVWKYSYELF